MLAQIHIVKQQNTCVVASDSDIYIQQYYTLTQLLL